MEMTSRQKLEAVDYALAEVSGGLSPANSTGRGGITRMRNWRRRGDGRQTARREASKGERSVERSRLERSRLHSAGWANPLV